MLASRMASWPALFSDFQQKKTAKKQKILKTQNLKTSMWERDVVPLLYAYINSGAPDFQTSLVYFSRFPNFQISGCPDIRELSFQISKFVRFKFPDLQNECGNLEMYSEYLEI